MKFYEYSEERERERERCIVTTKANGYFNGGSGSSSRNQYKQMDVLNYRAPLLWA
jgi:hypothetical protein